MEIIITAAIYLAIVTYLIIKLLTGIYRSNKNSIRTISVVISCIFAVFLGWESIDFFRNNHGKSFTVGWFGMAYFLVTSTTAFAVVCWILRVVGSRRM